MSKGLHCVIAGRVQGVGYRAATQRKALELGVSGWVKNLADGQVEVLLCGSEQQLASMHQWLHQGPDLASVSQVECREVDTEVPLGFEIQH